MVLKTGRKCNWDEVDLNEIVACEFSWENGHFWSIEQRISDSRTMIVGDDCGYCEKSIFNPGDTTICPFKDIYKLPGSIQELWREE